MFSTKEMPGRTDSFGWAWVTLCAALGLHIADETATDFLSIYNPTVMELRRVIPFLIAPTFGFREWLAGLILADAVLFSLSPLAFRGNTFARCLGYPFAGIMLLNGFAHIVGTIAGRTVSTVRFKRPMPGFWSSPLIIAASINLANVVALDAASARRSGVAVVNASRSSERGRATGANSDAVGFGKTQFTLRAKE